MITILLQIAGSNNQSAVIGRSTVEGYAKWIILESASFNLADMDGGLDDDSNSSLTNGSRESGLSQGRKRSQSRPKAQSIAISKTLDCSTVYLMSMAASDRSTEKRDPNRSARICFFQQRAVASGDKATALMPFLQIQLGSVIVDNWSISGSSGSTDSSENFSLNFKQFAMVYHRTEDAVSSLWHGPKGWDETERKEWEGPANWYSK